MKRLILHGSAKATASDNEIRAFYDHNKDAIGRATLDQVKDSLKSYLLTKRSSGRSENI